MRNLASEAISAAFSLIKNLPSVLLHLVVGQETRVFCVETVRRKFVPSFQHVLNAKFFFSKALIAAHFSDLSYFDPEGVETESSFGAFKDRAVLGNEQHIVGFFSCAKTDSHCLLV
jgi:hypothetical protein